MGHLKKVVFLAFLILLFSDYLYAADTSTVTIKGKVIDRVTLRPIINAIVTYKAKGVNEKSSTNATGAYLIRFNSSSNFILGQITSSAQEYKGESRLLIITGNNKNINQDFALKDITKPSLTIYSPKENQVIFTNAGIDLRYQEFGSGINPASISVSANSKDFSKYVRVINAQQAICVIPSTDPLEEGSNTITAQISDYAGNISAAEAHVTVVSSTNFYIGLGKKALLEHKLKQANNYFNLALSSSPRNSEANFYSAITRLALIASKKPIFNMLRLMGFTKRNGDPLVPEDLDPFNFNLKEPEGLKKFNLASTFPNGRSIQNNVGRVVIPEMDAVLNNLNRTLADKNFISHISIRYPITGTENIEIDYADAALLKSLICVIKSKIHEIMVRNTECDFAELSYLLGIGSLNPEYVLQNYPDLIRVKSVPQSLQARNMLILAIDSYIAAFNFLKAERDDQSDDLFSIPANLTYLNQAERFAKEILEIRKSLLGISDAKFSAKISQFINFGRYYTHPFDLRRLEDNDSAPYLLQNNILPPIDYVLNNLVKANINYREFLPPDSTFYKGTKREFDFADVYAIKANLEFIRTAILSVSAYNLNINADDIKSRLVNNEMPSLEYIFSSHPDLFRLDDAGKIISARDSFASLVRSYSKAADYLLFWEDSDQSDDLFVPQGYFWQNETKYRAMLEALGRMENVLINPIFEEEGEEFHLNLSEFFMRYKDLREFLPQFNENELVPGSWPDKTFGGIAPDTRLE